ncbi:MAG: hypothetical protein MJK12_06995 [Colwellia sp.]|nr:hypothetical protein [Colwellia sp.]
MNPTPPPSLLIQIWVDIARANQYPEAQEIAIKKLLNFFDDLSHAELFLAKGTIKTSKRPVINSVSQVSS